MVCQDRIEKQLVGDVFDVCKPQIPYEVPAPGFRPYRIVNEFAVEMCVADSLPDEVEQEYIRRRRLFDGACYDVEYELVKKPVIVIDKQDPRSGRCVQPSVSCEAVAMTVDLDDMVGVFTSDIGRVVLTSITDHDKLVVCETL